MFTMGLFIWEEDKKIVHVNDKPSFCNHVPEGIVHESLECRGGVGKSKEHYCWFEEALVRDEGGLPLVAILDVDVVITPVDIKFGE